VIRKRGAGAGTVGPVMDRFSRWSSSPQGLVVLVAVFAVGAVVDALLGHRTSAIVSGVLAIGILTRVLPGKPR